MFYKRSWKKQGYWTKKTIKFPFISSVMKGSVWEQKVHFQAEKAEQELVVPSQNFKLKTPQAYSTIMARHGRAKVLVLLGGNN